MRALGLFILCGLMFLASGLILVSILNPASVWTIELRDLSVFQGMLVVLALAQALFWLGFLIASGWHCLRQITSGAPRQEKPLPCNLAEIIRSKTEETLTRTADAIRDAILDWGPSEESADEDRPEAGTDTLPPMDTSLFVETMRVRVDETMSQVASLLNDSASGEQLAAREEEVRAILGELRWDAIALALQMRNDAAAIVDLASWRAPSGERLKLLPRKWGKVRYSYSDFWHPVWVEKYRHMRAAAIAQRLHQRTRSV
jgi:hypothetical protein